MRLDNQGARAARRRETRKDDDELKRVSVNLLASRGVTLADISAVVLTIQRPYYADLSLQECLESVEEVLTKREVQHAIITGITLDVLAEEGKLPEPLQGILRRDDFLYGVDEVLALGITNVYGSIGLTNFGYLDKEKIGILGRLHAQEDRVNTFLDDILAGIAAAAAARIAHNRH